MKMSQSNIKINFAYQMMYELLVIILPFITSPYIARVIGPEGLGAYSYTYSIAYYFLLFAMLGIANYGNRSISQCRDSEEKRSEVFSNLVALHMIIAVVVLFVYLVYIFLCDYERKLTVIQGLIILGGFFDISWFYFGIEKFKLTSIRSTIVKIVTVICVFVFVKSSNDLWKYCLIMAFGTFISNIVLWVPLHHYVHLQKPEWKKMDTHFQPLIILFIPAIAVSLYKYMDKIMIGSLSTKTQLGFYENAEKAINIPLTIISSFGAVMLPKMSGLAASFNKSEVLVYIKKSMQFVMWIAIALSFGLASVANIFAPVFWGKEFSFSGNIMIGLSVTIPFIAFANIIRTQVLIPYKKDREYLASVIIGAIINLIANWILIPSYGAIGATIGTIAAEISVCLVQCFVIRKELPLLDYVRDCIWYFLIGIVMIVPVLLIAYLANVSVGTLLIQIFTGAVIYCCLSFAYFKATKNELFFNMVRSVIRKIKH